MSYIFRTYSFADGDTLELDENCYIRVGSASAVQLESTILNNKTARPLVKGNDAPAVSNVFYAIGQVEAGSQMTTSKKLSKGDIIKITGGSAEVALLGER